jgi:TetR/AcrR family transcriptional repressor of bet genes
MQNSGLNTPRRVGPTRISDIRRQDLINAAIVSISEIGYNEVTVDTICKTAGVSRGLIGHYFSGKDELLLEAVKQVAAELGESTKKAARDAGSDPAARLHAVVKASFSPPGFTADKVSVWVALAGNARWSSELAEIYRQLWRSYRVGIGRLIGQAASSTGRVIDTQQAALTFAQLIEGLWIGWAADPDVVTQEQAEAACHRYLDSLLGTGR